MITSDHVSGGPESQERGPAARTSERVPATHHLTPLISDELLRLSGAFADPTVEAAFLESYREEHERRLRIAGKLVLVVSLLYVPLDLLNLDIVGGIGDLAPIYALRALMLVGAFVYLARARTRAALDRHALLGSLVIGLAYAGIYGLYKMIGIVAAPEIGWIWTSVIIATNYLYIHAHLGAATLTAGVTTAAIVAIDLFGFDTRTSESVGQIVAFTVIHVFSFTLARSLGRAQRVEFRLLDALFPPQVARSLRRGEPVAQQFDAVSVLFADLVGFTGLAASLPPAEVVAILDALFQEFDALAQRHGAEKIKTIGDCYMVAAGVPEPRPDHAAVLVDLALAMQASVAARRFAGRRLTLRIGIHSGPVGAGVVGRGRQLYDLWGDTVNVASRMESQGEPGAIQISPATADALGDAFVLRPRGAIEVKGRGSLQTFFVERRVDRPNHRTSPMGRPATGARP